MLDDNAKTDRPYDIVVVGATGFTGRLVVEYLAERYPDGSPRWAVAARNLDKLARTLGECLGNAPQPDTIVADNDDADSMAALAASTRVVLTTAGPYARYGSKLVAACAAAGTHYCDLAGETQWIRRMIDAHQDTARQSGAIIVPCCGFDSIPSDLGVHFLQREAVSRFGQPCREIRLLVRAMKGGASGGTFASMLNAVEEARTDRQVARVMADPYALNPAESRGGPDRRDQHGMAFDEGAGSWTAPFVMAAINTRVVRRSNALLGHPWGEDFRYSEATSTGRGAGGWFRSAMLTGVLGGFMLAASSNALRRKVVPKMLPAPGEGPDRAEREAGFFDLRLYGTTRDGDTIAGRVTGDRDPGYGSTSKMLSESAVCLASGEATCDGGLWTPASAMGDALERRLTENAGLTFELISG